MSVLVIIACLAGGEDCRPYAITEPIPWTQCMSGPTAMVEVRKWLDERPKRRLRAFKCVDPRRLPALIGGTIA